MKNQTRANYAKKLLTFPKALHRGFGLRKKLLITTFVLIAAIFSNSIYIGYSASNTSSFVVDDADATFVGDWGYSSYIPGFYDEGYRYNHPGGSQATATWSFNIPQAGSWEVFATWSSYKNRATNAPYTINHAQGTTTVTVNQEQNGGEWVSLGTYNFETGQTNVKLTDNANDVVIADAIQLVPKNTSPTPQQPQPTPEQPADVTITYSSNPAVDAFFDGDRTSSGDSLQVSYGTSVTVLAGQTQDYTFNYWLVDNTRHFDNRLTLENIVEDTNVIAVYTYVQQPDPQPTSDMIVGINIWSGTSVSQFKSKDIPLLKDAGIKYLRTGTGIRESFVDAARDAGIDVIGTLGTNGLPDQNAFGNYVYNRVLQFKGKVNAWVVFNEANYFGFNGDPEGYTRALRTAYTRAKQADPNVKIITSNFLSTEGGLSFLKDMYNNGAAGYFDVLGIDPYCYPEAPTQPNQDRWGHSFWRVPQLHDLMVQNGDGNKPVWIIEFGYRTPSAQYPLGNSIIVSETQQANYLVEAMELAQTWPWLERFYIYEWMDSADVNLGYWGLIRGNFDLKPAYYTVQQFNTN